MSESAVNEPVVVTFRQVERVLQENEAIQAVEEHARFDPDATDLQLATVATAIAGALDELRLSQQAVDAPVMNSPHSPLATRLQSLIALNSITLAPLRSGGLEAKFDTHDWIGWSSVAWQMIKHASDRHPLLRPKSAAPDSIPNDARIGIIGDWASGLYGAPHIAQAIAADQQSFDVLVHLGDVYYSGTVEEVQQRFLGIWPFRTGKVLHRALNSNHEMYSGGYGYFDHVLPRFEQEGSYFALQNDHWLILGLDLAYAEHDIDDDQLTWLELNLRHGGERRIVFLSHHQLFSHFESQGTKLLERERFIRILKDPRVVAWYWGHEHRCTIFDQPHSAFNLFGRCIGHGGMPQSRSQTRGLSRASGATYDRDQWVRSDAISRGGQSLPACVVLEGPNPYIKGEEDKFTPHGYGILMLEGRSLREQVLTPVGEVIYDHILFT